MKNYGLLGQRLIHSLSPEIHRELGNFRYELFQLEPEELDDFFVKRDFAGINVTFPYKKEVMKYCDEISDSAKKIGCVDIICVDENGKLIGDNCEFHAFEHMINKAEIDVNNKKVLIIGSGSNSFTIQAAVEHLGAKEVVVASRMGEVNYNNLYEHSDANIVINTTSIGMYPNNGEKIVNLNQFQDLCGVLDTIYNPRRTRLICDAEDLEVKNTDGLSMLVSSAYLSEIMFGRIEPDDELMKATYKTMSDHRKNIIFVGMPGCGKTTIAKVIAAKLGRPCIDLDKLIEMQAGVPLTTIFAAYGEKYYRELETQTLKKITRNGGQVIAPDSGCVMNKENQYYLRQNGYIVWLSRPLKELKHNGVYLAGNMKVLEQIQEERNGIYKFLADIKVNVTDNAETTVTEIINKINIKENPGIL
ncbi:MAG: AAA family ATPase [Ruminococcus sp.]|nr:AAA family ATPase [Candidatus Copronaster equi]